MGRLKFLMKNFRCKQIKADANRPILNSVSYKRSDTASPEFSIGAILHFLQVLMSFSGRYCIFVYLLLFTPYFLFAQGYIYWPENGIRVNPWGIASMVSDGKGGAIIFTGRDDSIFVQKINGDGELLWNGTHGYYVYGGESGELYGGAIACSDGRGGAIVVFGVWSWVTFDDIYAQRLDSLGNIMWGIGGVPVCTADSAERQYTVISDGADGGIFAWQDTRHVSIKEGDIYAQRVDSAGNLMWTINGVPVCTLASNTIYPMAVTDDSGGVIIAWSDSRNGLTDIYAQRLNADGFAMWSSNGIPIASEVDYQSISSITKGSQGGAIIVWNDKRSGDWDIYAQKVDGSGNTLWQNNGIPVCIFDSIQGGGQSVSDNNGGAIISWVDCRNGNYDIYIQKINSNGVKVWDSTGIPICIADSAQWREVLIFDGSGGAIIAWVDKRNYGASPQNWDIYGQHIDSSGTARWEINGMPICTAPGDQNGCSIVPDGAGGAIIKWRNGYGSIPGCGQVQRVNDIPPPSLPEISLSDTLHNFGNVVVGDSAFWEYLVIKNLGHGDLLIDSIISTDSAFSISETFPDTISFWDSVNISVKFIPQDTGYISGFLVIYSNDPDEESLSVRLVGNGVVGIAEVRSQRQEARLKIYPNPFFGKTTIRYRIHDTGFRIEDIKSQKMKDESQKISLKIYDVTGKLVRSLVNEEQRAGSYKIIWDGEGEDSRVLSGGVYFCILAAERHNFVKKMVLLR